MSDPRRRRLAPPPDAEDRGEEYEYTVEVRATEAFRNLMERQGINLEVDPEVTFTSEKLLRMKGLKEMGLVWSYRITLVKKSRQVIEEG